MPGLGELMSSKGRDRNGKLSWKFDLGSGHTSIGDAEKVIPEGMSTSAMELMT